MNGEMIGIREAKAQFSRLVREAQDGREWVITDHGRPVAKLVAVDDDLDLEERIRRLESRGVLGPAPKTRTFPRPLRWPGADLQRALQEDRDGGP